MRKHRSSTHLGRRTTLGLLTAGLAAPFIRPSLAQQAWPEQTTIPDILKGSGEVRVATFGGTMQEAQQRAYFEAFEKISGIKVRPFPGSDPTKVKAMVETGNVEWDMAQLSRGSIMNLQKRGDYFEKIDYDLVDSGVDAAYRFEYGLEMLVWAQVMAYRTDALKGAVPKGWADFWDTKKFPGERAMVGTSAGGWPELEFALMAAGVPADKLYPLDIDKGFASYDKIKKDVIKWWDTGAIPIQLLTDREVVMTTVWNGRMAALQAAGVPAAISWSQGLLKRDAWGIPKGAKNKANAMKFAAYSTMAIPQARIAYAIPYGSVNNKSNEYIPPERLSVLPSAPDIKSQLVNYNYDWWIDNRDTVVNRFNKWLLS
ncbi:MAG TPA: ABC transporter substrate-binding protein [Reyranella sp.]|jgi:putative spermidine/putrescine transport system substrate-binding protein|nr:putative spermidine/putrescine transport system substrate-binding protein [Rhodospirillaceae bacterium]MEA2848531.1 putative spermidine/putrescine transport system substrate-binding protein [Rhodospirillaceae bacterium]